MTEQALVVASYGHRHLVRFSSDQSEHLASERGKRSEACVGDLVRARRVASDQAVIEQIEPRRSFLQRADRWRSKSLAANADQAALVVAGEPPYCEELLLRLSIAVEAAGLDLLIIANKADLLDAHARIQPRLEVLRALGYPVIELAALGTPAAAREALQPWLADATTILLGESGMGKSTLVNLVAPHARQVTRAISIALGSGRHTTTSSRLLDLGPGARIIDTPGFRTFGLAHLSASERVHGVREFRPLLGQCRFHSCTHRGEPGCALRAAAEAGHIDALRYRLFTELYDRD